jgi:DNA-binding CsgD family transcriptional regulator
VDTPAQVAALRGDGLTTAQIAAQLGVSERTVRRHAARALAHEHDDSKTREGISA